MFGIGFGTENAVYINFGAGPGDTPATRIEFAGGQDPFETDNHALQAVQQVPEPTSLLLLLAGGFGLATRSRPKR